MKYKAIANQTKREGDMRAVVVTQNFSTRQKQTDKDMKGRAISYRTLV
jgi:hypothetical protein